MEHKDRVLTEKEQRQVLYRLLGYAKPHAKTLSIAFTLLLLATAAELMGPILVKIFIDDYLTPQVFPTNELVLLAVLYLSLHISSVFVNYFQSFLFQKVSLRIIQQLRVDVFSNVERLGLAFFDKTPAGGLISRITNDTESIKELYVTVLATFVQNIMFLIGVFVAMFYLNTTLALYCLFLIPILLGLMHLYRKWSSTFYADMSEKLSQLNAKMNESIQGMAIIQMFRQEKRLRKEFSRVNDEHLDAGMKSMKLDGLLLRPMVDLISILALILVLSYFGVTSFVSPVEIGVIYAFVNYLDRFFEPVNQMMMRLSLFQQAIVSAGRVFKLMDHQDYAPSQQGRDPHKIEQGDITFRDLTFSYDGKTDVLKNISFTVKKGETVALVGHTGSGKSSIINLLMRFYPLCKGDIIIDGKSLYSYPNEELRREVGLVLQDPFLYTGTIAHNIRLNRDGISDEQVRASAEFVQADEFIQRLPNQYDTVLAERGSTLSSGQRQLLSFARTMATNPKVLILDEATANVDTETEEAIQMALRKMQEGRTTIAIAHRLSTIKDADQILVLHQGEIVERGNHEELLKREGLYHKMYLLQKGSNEKIKLS
ncbi:ABC transporter transmembrane domain-containing protein [Alkalihalophilus marmarensis]|jgi:ATP-binding cassette subfamily B protein|uniref:Multidrug ABC transporter ATP-binding protein n=1 Tax=Alkalihalophilus marmarensis DSM 21297 TaxID=1188261 RepID=U6SPN2_9BACI|nr:ABC transporter transmembrane domain-containing protein [Alkalihalophilus marmarensis]ERN53317.1 multidrug ABC transporter ATP-binding protein [Alkalihalophilus marmarensis DSM 21297]MCM3489474.1 ABC transporter transmembrane domain-containing protein [Alkalihalophilus marmarensis]